MLQRSISDHHDGEARSCGRRYRSIARTIAAKRTNAKEGDNPDRVQPDGKLMKMKYRSFDKSFLNHQEKMDPAIVYADNNSTTPIHPRVLEQLGADLATLYGNPSTSYRPGAHAKSVIDESRAKCCSMFQSPNTIFVSSASEANNLVIRSIVGTAGKCISAKPHVILSSIEHPSVYNTVKSLTREGLCVHDVAPVTKQGVLIVNKLLDLVRDTTVLVCVIRSNNETGVVQDMASIAAALNRVRNRQIPIHLHTDATQCIGKVPFILEGDTAVISAHKFRGPKGIAAVLVKHLDSIHPICTGGGQELGLRAGTESAPMIRALTNAAEIAIRNVPPVIDEDNTTTLESLRDEIEDVLEELGCQINSRDVYRLPNTCSAIMPPGASGKKVMDLLSSVDICVNVGSACSEAGKSGTLRSMGRTKDEESRALRISLGTQNTHANVKRIIRAIRDILK